MANDVYAGSHGDLIHLLHRTYETKIPLYVHGTFGIGKTKLMQQFAQQRAAEMGLEYSANPADINNPKMFCCRTLILHHFDGGEIKGIPFPNNDKTKTVYLPVGLLPEKGQGILFLDEMNLASQMMQNNAYQLIEDRCIGNYFLPDGYLAVAAGNLVDDRGNTYDLPMPLNNRFIHFQLKVPPVTDCEVDGRNIIGWVNGYALPKKLDHRIINYLITYKDDIFTFKSKMSDVVAVASPRMWEKVSAMIQGITDEYSLEMFVAGGVGLSLAQKFIGFIKLSEKFDIEALFNGTQKLEKPKEISTLYSLLSAIIGHYLEKIKPVIDLPIESEKAVKGNKLAIKFLELATAFNKEHSVMLLNQAKAVDAKLLKRMKHTDLKLFMQFADSTFKLLLP